MFITALIYAFIHPQHARSWVGFGPQTSLKYKTLTKYFIRLDLDRQIDIWVGQNYLLLLGHLGQPGFFWTQYHPVYCDHKICPSIGNIISRRAPVSFLHHWFIAFHFSFWITISENFEFKIPPDDSAKEIWDFYQSLIMGKRSCRKNYLWQHLDWCNWYTSKQKQSLLDFTFCSPKSTWIFSQKESQ